MQQSDSYHTIRSEACTEIKIKGSKFIGRAFACEDVARAQEILNRIRKEFHDATHNCYAYRVGFGKHLVFKYSDDGEPSGTAGRPIYDQLKGQDLTNVILIVTRYYGGTKLGTGGLTHAYSTSAANTIKQAGVIEQYVTDRITVAVQLADYNVAARLICQIGAKIVQSDFADRVTLVVEIRISLREKLMNDLANVTSGRARIV
ncbi:MAG: YigZ family protein [Candidatus Zixiibacteriota bacterium]|nr:MAG: YigZ family protein [candidate division Zixibacteria bacterium]